MVKWDEGGVHVMTHALHYGLGVFEGIRAYKTHDGRLAVFRLREHIRRLLDSAHIIQLKMPYSEDELVEACLELLRKQKNLFANGAYLRPVAFMGDGAMGLGAVNPTRVAVTAWDWGAYLGDKGIKEGIRGKVSSFTRMHVNVNMVRGKITGQYVNSILAKRETVLHLLRDSGRAVDEVTFTRDALYICNEIFFTGTAAEITPVREVDNRTVGTGKPGPITQFVQEAYFRTVRGQEPRYAEWLTYV
jgi:branched-chain amino acid aminotransferase